MDRPDAHRPTGARQHDPGPAGAPLAAVTPIRRSRDLAAPHARRLTDQPAGGARHRIEGGPTTPAGIPVVSAATIREAERAAAADPYATDRLPVVGGAFDPGARHSIPDIAFSIEDNGPDTDELPIITSATPGWSSTERPPSGYDTGASRHSRLPHLNLATDTSPANSAPDHRGVETFPPRPAPDHRGVETFPSRPAPRGADAFPPRPAPDNRAPDTSTAGADNHRADAFGPRPSPDFRATESFSSPAASGSLDTDNEPARPAPDYNGDDEVFARMIDRSKRRHVPRWVAPLVASVAGAVLLGGTYVQLRGPAPASTAASSPLVPSSVSPVTAACPTEQIGAMVRGNGAGGTESGIAAILAFQYAYYVARSGDEARTLLTADAAAPSAAAIQAGIDSTPVGTTHC
ncbi:MAG: hypothetical protein H5T78_10070, partial [Nocardia sp.]|nr:hypothetical protein [Nocardia sp.]